jgi:hypothetical protein
VKGDDAFDFNHMVLDLYFASGDYAATKQEKVALKTKV